jgi:hypothetical protein
MSAWRSHWCGCLSSSVPGDTHQALVKGVGALRGRPSSSRSPSLCPPRSQTEDEQRDQSSPRQSQMGRQRRRGPRTTCTCAPWRKMGLMSVRKRFTPTWDSDSSARWRQPSWAAANRGTFRLWDRAENSPPHVPRGLDVPRLVSAQEGFVARSISNRPTIHELANMAAQRLRSQDEDDPMPRRGIRAKEQPSKKEAKEIAEMRKFRNPKLASKKVVLNCTRNVLRCINNRCKANFWNRDVNAARNMLELLRSGLKGKLGASRLRAFRRNSH